VQAKLARSFFIFCKCVAKRNVSYKYKIASVYF